MRPGGWALIQYDCVLIKQELRMQRHTREECHMKMKAEIGVTQQKPRSDRMPINPPQPQTKQTPRHLDLGLLASRTVRDQISVV